MIIFVSTKFTPSVEGREYDILFEKCRTRRKKDYKKKETRTVNVSPFGFIRTTERELEEVEGSYNWWERSVISPCQGEDFHHIRVRISIPPSLLIRCSRQSSR